MGKQFREKYLLKATSARLCNLIFYVWSSSFSSTLAFTTSWLPKVIDREWKLEIRSWCNVGLDFLYFLGSRHGRVERPPPTSWSALGWAMWLFGSDGSHLVSLLSSHHSEELWIVLSECLRSFDTNRSTVSSVHLREEGRDYVSFAGEWEGAFSHRSSASKEINQCHLGESM